MRTIDVNVLLDEARFNAFHWRVLFWCALIIVFDGYDLVIYGVVLPVLMQEWGLTPLQAGALGSYALFGMMFGALFFGSLSDRIGRRKVIACCVILFSLFTVLNGLARNPGEFAACRFIAGLGIGGVMPNVVALMNEYAPKRSRGLLVAIMFSGYSVGGMLSAGLGIVLIPAFGWSSVFFVAVLPLLLLPLAMRQLPESVSFLLGSGGAEGRAGDLLHAVEPRYRPQPGDRFSIASGKVASVGVSQLFHGKRTLCTLMLWMAFFCCLLMVYALNSWLPKLMSTAGYGLGSSLAFLLVLNLGAIIGAIAGGWLGDRFGLDRVLVAFFAMAALAIALLGLKSPAAVLYLLVALAGAGTIGTQILANACAVQFYPAQVRSTGLGWAMGIGRTGAIIGPLLGGALLAAQLPLALNFLVFAAPGAVAALAMMLFIHRRQALAGQAPLDASLPVQ
ncbi:MFS transporter, AAHS family, benzoate transport protein [Pseudomonas flavescens]|uniref:MFS transporter, AAHS family, benzoate transport protein n=1 Tax=Phytopseudomonas flavescens TaxID=29435 RepID=A0A1G7ZI69_9GAMM|nr:MFS transporter [Pseudomonas flavescens]SDH08398.1 MFS transporter, AAHS family, benzoate transport protein [Pseudomonas flavescens]